MNLLPILITARRDNWRHFHGRKQNKRFVAVQHKIFERDGYSCRFCGFYAKEFQDVVNIDHNYDNNTFENMATACCFCTQCFFLNAVGTDDPHMDGEIIHLPEISQANLNNFCRVLFCSMEKDTAYKSKLQSVYLNLKDRGKAIVDCFGPDSNTPSVFGQGLIDCNLSEEALNHPLLQEVRMLPIKKTFKKQIDYWKKTVFAKIPL
jgi:intracellular multiplication protein IcmJ